MIRLSLSKLQIGQEVSFAGHLIGKNGIKPDPQKVEALRDFATPTTSHSYVPFSVSLTS
jgi:hypothetical protein